MVTVGRDWTRLPAPRGTRGPLPATGNHTAGGATGAGYIHCVLTGIAGTAMAPGQAFVVLTVEGLPTHLFTGRAVPSAALPVTLVSLAVSGAATLYFTGERLGTLHLLLSGSTPAIFHFHLQTGRTGAPVTPLRAVMTLTAQNLATSISASGRGLGAGKADHGLTTGTLAVLGERAGRAGTRGVAD